MHLRWLGLHLHLDGACLRELEKEFSVLIYTMKSDSAAKYASSI